MIVLASCGGGGGIAVDLSDGPGDQGHEVSIVSDPGHEPEATVQADIVDGDLHQAENDHGTLPGEAGWPCTHHSACIDGICAETPDGSRCAGACLSDEDCEPPMVCGPISADAAHVCLHPAARTCQPCTETADCRVYPLLAASKLECVDMGSKWFCLEPCAEELDCGHGFVCDVPGDRGEGHCIPEMGQCSCSGLGKEKQLEGTCTAANETGECPGAYHCTADGLLTKCDAPVPSVEECNQVDDDCNGTTDDGEWGGACTLENEHGSCPGVTACEQGDLVCLGQEPGPEECNGDDDDCDGTTDEGFSNLDNDGLADCVDPDMDGDGVLNDNDNCPQYPNYTQADAEDDGIGDACDPDDDNDTVLDKEDNCPFAPNPGQEDLDSDGEGDACDNDWDGDGVLNETDNCPLTPNQGQGDIDGDEKGDECDSDMDGDGKPNGFDNCPAVPNGDQTDTDNDAFGDACDLDDDNDQLADGDDNCPLVVNPLQKDMDADGIGDKCDPDRDGDMWPNDIDNCPDDVNPQQEDVDENGVGDACEPDLDGDGVPNESDNCPLVANSDQADVDGDDVGDACDCDIDGDGMLNPGNGCAYPQFPDNCPFDDNPVQADFDGDGVGDVCDPDRDGDGVPNDDDCEPDNPIVYPGHPEVCNGKDDNCDGVTDDEGAVNCVILFKDTDEDGYGSGNGKCLCEPFGFYTTTVNGDCGPTDPAVHPGAMEACTGKDDNCDGNTDPDGASGCQIYWVDGDEDGWGDPSKPPRCLCHADPWQYYTTTKTGDCKDSDPEINPGIPEVCNGKDDDCDSVTDGEGSQGCSVYYLDEDRDNYGVDGQGKCLCEVFGFYDTLNDGDCDDDDELVNPGAQESCDGKDTDCDGNTDEANAIGCTYYYTDEDDDGYGVTPLVCLCAPTDEWKTTATGDCDDTDADTHPGADEACDGKDNDCDNMTDEGCP